MALVTETVYTAVCDTCGAGWEDHYDFAVASPADLTAHGWRIANDGETIICSDCAYRQHADEPARW